LIMYTQSQKIEKANYLKVFMSKTTKNPIAKPVPEDETCN